MSDQIANQSGRWHVTAVPETGSTNADLLKIGAEGAPDRTVLRADFQSAGRGRLNRTWDAPAGVNLLVSLLFRPVPPRPHVLTQAVALSAVAVAADLCDVVVDLKWPNDLLIEGTKAAGILAQAAPAGPDGTVPFVVVGIGLNLGWAPEGATSLAASGWTQTVAPQDFLLAMLPHIDRFLALGDDALHSEYVSRVATIGTRVKAQMPDGNDIVGRAVDVEKDGRLVVLDDCAVTHRIDTADVVHLRPALD